MGAQVGGLGPDDGLVGQLYRAAHDRGEPGREDRADRLEAVVRAHARGGRVAEDEQLHGLARSGAVDPVVVGRPVEGVADDLAGDLGLGLDEPVAETGQRGAGGGGAGSTQRGLADDASQLCHDSPRVPGRGPNCVIPW